MKNFTKAFDSLLEKIQKKANKNGANLRVQKPKINNKEF